ncbi:MAG: hypothetical protein PGN16_04280 [Sphingomonas phyllosphaerae]|uniref:hypothetical protein n=1 Tax=Sphingomonas phyllosphaerae TaxID=257003 RepID=UPI002FF7B34A
MTNVRQSSAISADPVEVRAVFLRGGWRALERNYGASTPVLLQLIAKAGGPALLAERAAVQTNGRRAGVVR